MGRNIMNKINHGNQSCGKKDNEWINGQKEWMKECKNEKKKKWLRDWDRDHENGNRERIGSSKDGNKIKEWRNIQWEVSRMRKKDICCEEMKRRNGYFSPNFNQNLSWSSELFSWSTLLLLPPAGSSWLDGPEERARKCRHSEKQQLGKHRNHWIAERQAKIISTEKSSNRDKTLNLLYLATSLLFGLQNQCFLP